MSQTVISQEKCALLVFGASGHAKVIMDIVERGNDYMVGQVVDDNPALQGMDIYGYRILGGRDVLGDRTGQARGMHAVVAIGNNRIRADIANWLCTNGAMLSRALVHPSAQLARGIVVGDGSVVMAGAIVNPDAHIGKNVIINTSAVVEHDCTIGDAVHVAPGATLCGGIMVGENSLVGAGAVIHPNVRIGRNVIIGAGATVLGDVQDGLTVAGTPAKPIR